MTQQTCLLRDTADIVCCVTQQTCLLCHTADMSAVSHNRHCLLCHTADMSAVSHSRHVCCEPLPSSPTENGGFVSHEGGKPPPTCDTKPWYSPCKIYITQVSGLVSLEGGGMPPPSCDTKPPFCVGLLERGSQLVFVSQTKLWIRNFGSRHLPYARG